jgi:hypothetical protein
VGAIVFRAGALSVGEGMGAAGSVSPGPQAAAKSAGMIINRIANFFINVTLLIGI